MIVIGTSIGDVDVLSDVGVTDVVVTLVGT